MKIDSLLNVGPVEASAADSANQQVNGVNSTMVSAAAVACPPLPNAPFTQYHQSTIVYHEQTVSTRRSYSGPSSNSSTANVRSVERSNSQPNNSGWYSGDGNSTQLGDTVMASKSPEKEHTSRTPILPSFTSFVKMQQHLPEIIGTDGALSLRSSYRQVAGSSTGYLEDSPLFQYNQTQPSYQNKQPSPFSSPNSSGVTSIVPDPLMRFADVAMESATVSGRRNLDEEAAAEVLGVHRCDGSVESVTENSDQLEPTLARRNASINIDPALRSETSNIKLGKFASSSISLENCPSPSDSTPLYCPSPEQFKNLSISNSNPKALLSENTADESTPKMRDFSAEIPKCSYCKTCTTGSPLRKVVSHIFGRNKMSTRQIPENVWMYYCRKHYQRSRYRNPRGFARQQLMLVRKQCERLEQWGGVQHWIIKVRRREELRMNRQGDIEGHNDHHQNANVGLIGSIKNYNGGVSGVVGSRPSMRRSSSYGANSNWFVQFTGVQKSLEDVHVLLDRIEAEVQENGGKFPDVELLPYVERRRGLSADGPPNICPNAVNGGDGNGEHNQETGPPNSRKRERSIYRNPQLTGGGKGRVTKKAKGYLSRKSAGKEKVVNEKINENPRESMFESSGVRIGCPSYMEPLGASEPKALGPCAIHTMQYLGSPFTPPHSTTNGGDNHRSPLYETDTEIRSGVHISTINTSRQWATRNYVLHSPHQFQGRLPSPFRPTPVSTNFQSVNGADTPGNNSPRSI